MQSKLRVYKSTTRMLSNYTLAKKQEAFFHILSNNVQYVVMIVFVRSSSVFKVSQHPITVYYQCIVVSVRARAVSSLSTVVRVVLEYLLWFCTTTAKTTK